MSSRRRVRPFVVTGGRAAPVVDLRVESILLARGDAGGAPSPEHRAIVALCAQPQSLAEVAVAMAQPVGVARILAADLVSSGVLEEHSLGDGDTVDTALLERVLSGIRAL